MALYLVMWCLEPQKDLYATACVPLQPGGHLHRVNHNGGGVGGEFLRALGRGIDQRETIEGLLHGTPPPPCESSASVNMVLCLQLLQP